VKIKESIVKHHIVLGRVLIIFSLVLLAFLSEPSYFVASSVQPDCFIASVVPFCGSHMVCSLGSQVATEQLWTPIILLNSPYGGTSQGTSTIQTTTSIKIVSGNPNYGGALVEVSSTNSIGSKINETNGGAGGVFELDTWTIYNAVTIWIGGDGQDNPCTQPYVAKITAHSGNLYIAPLLQPGTKSDVNEPTSVNSAGYSSVIFHNGWNNSASYSTISINGQSGFTLYVSTTNAIVTSLTIGFGSNTISGTLTEGTSSTNDYSYSFPAYGCWEYQWLNPSYPTYSALAFYYVGSTPC
jgi:hypothetical protein